MLGSCSDRIRLFGAVALLTLASAPAAAPYPDSSVITGVAFDWNTHERRAAGSDNWPLTWADDDHQYAAWGDGPGFGGRHAGLGVARIEGGVDSYHGTNVWSGEGKSYGIVSVGRTLYMWVSPGSNEQNFSEARLYKSTNHGASWAAADWAFTRADGLILPTFLQFGKDYAGARDAYVYIYANHLTGERSFLEVQIPGEIALLRVPKTAIMDRGQYEFYAGTDANCNPVWTRDPSARQPVFVDPNGVGWATSGVLYNSGLGRYLLIAEHERTASGNLGIFEGPEPWGPWHTVYYGNIDRPSFYYNLSAKWMSEDGRGFVMVFSGGGGDDAWNGVRGVFATMPIQRRNAR